MPKTPIRPHPTLDIKCGVCKFWHPGYVMDAVIGTPQGVLPAPIPVAEFIKQGQNISQCFTARVSICFQAPNWVNRTEDHYCSQFEAAKPH